jgi:hypothetical protein
MIENNNFLETAFNNSWVKGLDHINESINTELLPVAPAATKLG